MSDLISRQAAILAIEDMPNAYNGWSDTYDKACIIGVLEEVPSADKTQTMNEQHTVDHDRDWIIGCIKHDGFIHTHRFDKANQIILDAFEASQNLTKANNSDLISRADAIEAVATVTMSIHLSNVLCDKLLALPSADRQTGWIPVSERLPDDDGRYLVTYPLLRRDDLWVATAWYGTPPMPNRPVKGKCFFVSDDEWGDVPYDDVVAWMPLPEPYKGGEE